eukprot:GHVQ01012624.1.p1 GENE.GHVQ01012624.1~~GHVQ01012624.1.p1  ORF type:complete len:777 (-),score=63.74 GHVQ01012624.1:182-2512(-)
MWLRNFLLGTCLVTAAPEPPCFDACALTQCTYPRCAAGKNWERISLEDKTLIYEAEQPLFGTLWSRERQLRHLRRPCALTKQPSHCNGLKHTVSAVVQANASKWYCDSTLHNWRPRKWCQATCDRPMSDVFFQRTPVELCSGTSCNSLKYRYSMLANHQSIVTSSDTFVQSTTRTSGFCNAVSLYSKAVVLTRGDVKDEPLRRLLSDRLELRRWPVVDSTDNSGSLCESVKKLPKIPVVSAKAPGRVSSTSSSTTPPEQQAFSIVPKSSNTSATSPDSWLVQLPCICIRHYPPEHPAKQQVIRILAHRYADGLRHSYSPDSLACGESQKSSLVRLDYTDSRSCSDIPGGIRFHYIVLTSAEGAAAFLDCYNRALPHKDSSRTSNRGGVNAHLTVPPICSIGPSVTRLLASHGVQAAFTPPSPSANSIAQFLPPCKGPGCAGDAETIGVDSVSPEDDNTTNVLLLTSSIAPPSLKEQLECRTDSRFRVYRLDIYDTQPCWWSPDVAAVAAEMRSLVQATAVEVDWTAGDGSRKLFGDTANPQSIHEELLPTTVNCDSPRTTSARQTRDDPATLRSSDIASRYVFHSAIGLGCLRNGGKSSHDTAPEAPGGSGPLSVFVCLASPSAVRTWIQRMGRSQNYTAICIGRTTGAIAEGSQAFGRVCNMPVDSKTLTRDRSNNSNGRKMDDVESGDVLLARTDTRLHQIVDDGAEISMGERTESPCTGGRVDGSASAEKLRGSGPANGESVANEESSNILESWADLIAAEVLKGHDASYPNT